MRILESIKLKLRANKYKNKDDKGGIAYINSAIKKGETVFDIGAHKGGYLYFMLKAVGNEGKVFAFEPQTMLYNYLLMLKQLLKWNNVRLEQIALSDTTTTTTLYIPVNKVSKGSSPGATIVKSANASAFGATENVSTNTLDAYCLLHNIKPDFLKIDVEGNELKLLKGAINVLKNYKPKIIVEVERRHVGESQAIETFNFLKSYGYKGKFIHGIENIPLEKFDFEKYQNTNDMTNYCNNFIFE